MLQIRYKTDYDPREIKCPKIMTRIRRLFKTNPSNCYKVSVLEYGLNARYVQAIVEKKGYVYKIREDGNLRFRTGDPVFDHDQIHLDVSWLSPDGILYPTVSEGHERRAYSLQEEGVIPPETNNPSGWMSENGWIKINNGEIPMSTYYNKLPVTDKQLETLKELLTLNNPHFHVEIHNVKITDPDQLDMAIKTLNTDIEKRSLLKITETPRSRFGFRDGD